MDNAYKRMPQRQKLWERAMCAPFGTDTLVTTTSERLLFIEEK